MTTTLTCMRVGKTGRTFTVKFAKSELIGELKKAIKEARSNELKEIDASDLKLYLAKRGGVWLKDNNSDDTIKQLKGGDITGDIDDMCKEENEMESSWSLQEWLDEYKMPEPATREIHVLVKVPLEQKTDTPDNSLLEAIQKIIKETFKHTLDEMSAEKKERESVALSQLTSAKRARLTEKLNLEVKFIHIEQSQLRRYNENIPIFEWRGDAGEEYQADSYHKYVQEHLQQTLKDCKLTLVSVHQYKSLLTIDDDRLPFMLRGGTDMLILEDLEDDTMDALPYFPGLRMAIEVKKDLNVNLDAGVSQAIGELVAIDLKAPHQSAMVLLTDLNHMWVFLWLGDQCIYRMPLRQPSHAFAFMREAISKWNQSDGSVHIPFAEYRRRPLKRRKINDMLPSIAESETKQTLCEMIERYRSIEDEVGLDMSMPREIGRFVVQSMPAYYGMYT